MARMKSLNVELPDRLADDVARLVKEGWFQSENELVRTALAEFLRSRQAELQERFQREDISWAVAESKPRQK
jgi:Arc/MetJ-type ribon-helix-helix transcriptional regulator